MRRFRCALVLVAVALGVLACSSDAHAYRPFDGTDADVAEPGDFELELGPVHWYSQAGSHYLVAPATVLNLGFVPRWELVVDFQNLVGIDSGAMPDRDQLRDTDVLLKTVLVEGSLQEQGAGPSVAVELGPLVPTIGDSEGKNGFGASADVVVSQRWKDLVIHANSWFELTRGDLHADWFEGIIVEGLPEQTVRPVSEWFVEHEWVENVTTWSGLVGAIWRARDGLDLDAGLREARIGGDRATEVRLGLTWTLGLWEPTKEEGHGQNTQPRSARFALAR
jgi:hypothetical protein